MGILGSIICRAPDSSIVSFDVALVSRGHLALGGIGFAAQTAFPITEVRPAIRKICRDDESAGAVEMKLWLRGRAHGFLCEKN